MSKTYTTKLGDKWDTIALSQYGSKSFVDDLIQANGQYCKIYIFPAGIELDIPDVNKSTVRASLPPWKRVL